PAAGQRKWDGPRWTETKRDRRVGLTADTGLRSRRVTVRFATTAERALTALAPRRLREAGAAGRTAFPRGAMCERRRQLVRHRRFVPVQGTVAQTPELRGLSPGSRSRPSISWL